MVNVFGQPARESAFLSAVKRIVSGVCNSFWQDVCPSSSLQCLFLYLHGCLQIQDSILAGNSQSSLEAFTVNTMHKYRAALVNDRGMQTRAGKRDGYVRVLVWVLKAIPVSFQMSPKSYFLD